MHTHSSTLPAALCAVAALTLAAPAEGATLSHIRTILNTDYASAGFGGMRGDGRGTIELTGVTGTVTHAFLYWHGPQWQPDTNASVTFAGQSIIGTSIGMSGENCWWGYAHSQAYRADVTSLVTGSGFYALDDFYKPGLADINGVSLLVAYDDGVAGNNRDLMLFEGNDSNLGSGGDDDGWLADLGSFQYASGDVVLELGVADGQFIEDAALEINNQELVPDGAIFQGSSVPNGATAGETNGGLWDIRRYEIDSLLTPGTNTLHLSSYVNSDCLSLVHAVLELPAGSSPVPPPPRPVPDRGNSLALLAVAVAALRWMARRLDGRSA